MESTNQNSLSQSHEDGNPLQLSAKDLERTHEEFFAAIRSGTPTIVQLFLDKYGAQYDLVNMEDKSSKQTSLYVAAILKDENASVEISKILLKFGAKVNHIDSYNQTALYYIARDGKLDLFNLYVEHGVEVNHTDNYSQSALFYAARDNRVNIVRRLLELGANPNQLDHFKETCLFYAAREGRYEVCKILIEKGVNVNQVDKDGQVALTFAKKNNHTQVVNLLIENGATNPNSKAAPKKVVKKGKIIVDFRNIKNPKSFQYGLELTAPSESSNLSKRKNQLKNKVKASFRLVVTEGENQRQMTNKEFEIFAKKWPKIAEILLDTSKIPEDFDEERDTWLDVAMNILNTLWKAKKSNIFHRPVDPIKLAIPDYFTVVKNPMDLSTVKHKLQSNVYSGVDEWIKDMSLIFHNCKLYNGTETEVGKIGVAVKEEFEKLVESYNIVERFKDVYVDEKPEVEIEEEDEEEDDGADDYQNGMEGEEQKETHSLPDKERKQSQDLQEEVREFDRHQSLNQNYQMAQEGQAD